MSDSNGKWKNRCKNEETGMFFQKQVSYLFALLPAQLLSVSSLVVSG